MGSILEMMTKREGESVWKGEIPPAPPGLPFFSQTHIHLLLVERVHPLHRRVEGCDHLQKAGLLFTQGVRQQVRRDFDS